MVKVSTAATVETFSSQNPIKIQPNPANAKPNQAKTKPNQTKSMGSDTVGDRCGAAMRGPGQFKEPTGTEELDSGEGSRPRGHHVPCAGQ